MSKNSPNCPQLAALVTLARLQAKWDIFKKLFIYSILYYIITVLISSIIFKQFVVFNSFQSLISFLILDLCGFSDFCWHADKTAKEYCAKLPKLSKSLNGHIKLSKSEITKWTHLVLRKTGCCSTVWSDNNDGFGRLKQGYVLESRPKQKFWSSSTVQFPIIWHLANLT